MITYVLNPLKNCLILNNSHGDFDELLARFGDYGIQADHDNILYLLATDAYFIIQKQHLILTNGDEEFFCYDIHLKDDLNQLTSVLLINTDTPINNKDISTLIAQQALLDAGSFLYELEQITHSQIEGFIIGVKER